MKLKFELVNGYGVLLDDSIAETGKPYYGYGQKKVYIKQKGVIQAGDTIVFAEKELGLDVPVFEWRDFEVEKLAIKEFPHDTGMSIVARGAFRKGYQSNPAKYTESDLRKAISMARDYPADVVGYQEDEIIQSLQKFPKYVVMESELVDSGNHGSGEIFHNNRIEEFTLFTNSERKQQGTIKELIWT
jgi:hypothetical protein